MSNRLQHEKSPYLLQHKDNPVDWWPWSKEAFEAARSQDRPVFLSIGYSTCHWCHVMERESFEDPQVAQLMNDAFINIKVDREERPDIDAVYMGVCQMITGSGGWPLTVIMTPEKEPFFVDTYIPKENRHQKFGMKELIVRVRHVWFEARDAIEEDGSKITEMFQKSVRTELQGDGLVMEDLDRAYRQLRSRFDYTHGGFGTTPKFPVPHHLLFLLRYWKRTGSDESLRMVEMTLQHMRRGGIFDQLGYGFHRYSTDQSWTVPHFEKMLYDQAMLALAYTEAYQATGREGYSQTAKEIFTYVFRDLTNSVGAFCCAEDADSEGQEGKFYLWYQKEIFDILPEDLARLVVQVYQVEAEGNFVHEVGRERTGENILHMRLSEGDEKQKGDVGRRLQEAHRLLLSYRASRIRPERDDKVLTDWNGLMIAALARAARVFHKPAYVQAARRAAVFIRSTMLQKDGRLLHRWREGVEGIEGMLDDYAFFIWGLLELYETTFAPEWLQLALALNENCMDQFWDEAHAAFFLTAADAEPLLVRPRDAYDGAIPSGNSVMAMNLLRLARITGNSDMEHKGWEIIRFFAKAFRAMPSGFTAMLSALDFALGPSFEIVVAGIPDAADTQTMLQAAHSLYQPNKVVLFRPDDGSGDVPDIVRLVPMLEAHKSRAGVATAYVCKGFQCEQPTTSPSEVITMLQEATES